MLKGHKNVVHGLAFSHDGKTLATASYDKSVRLWNVDKGQPISVFNGHQQKVYAVTFSHDQKQLIAADATAVTQRWELTTGKVVGKVANQNAKRPQWVHAVAFSPDARELASGYGYSPHGRSVVGEVRVRELVGGREQLRLRGHDNFVYSVCFSPDGKWIASGGWDGKVKLWSRASGKVARTWSGHEGIVLGLAFSPDSRSVASTGYDQFVRVWGVS